LQRRCGDHDVLSSRGGPHYGRLLEYPVNKGAEHKRDNDRDQEPDDQPIPIHEYDLSART
jgi:hypothetical protein